MEEGENEGSTSTSYNISVESYSKMQDDIDNSCKYIQSFIDLHSEKYSKSEIFKTLVALHDLFKLEISHGMQLRQTLINEKNELSKTRTELRAFFSFLGSSFNKNISSISQAKHFLKSEKRKIDEINAQHTMEIAQYSSKLDIAIDTNNKLQAQINGYMHQIEVLKNDKKELVKSDDYMKIANDNTELRLKIQNLETQLNDYKLKITRYDANEEKIRDLENTVKELTESKIKSEENNKKLIEQNKSLEEQNSSFVSKIALISQHVSDVQDKYSATVEKLQSEITKNAKEIKKLKKEISLKDETYSSTIQGLEKDKSLLVSSIKRMTEGKQEVTNNRYKEILEEISRIVGVTDFEELPSIIAKMSNQSELSTEVDDDYSFDSFIGIRPLMLVAMTCNRLLSFSQGSSSDLQSEIDKLKKELISTRLELARC